MTVLILTYKNASLYSPSFVRVKSILWLTSTNTALLQGKGLVQADIQNFSQWGGGEVGIGLMKNQYTRFFLLFFHPFVILKHLLYLFLLSKEKYTFLSHKNKLTKYFFNSKATYHLSSVSDPDPHHLAGSGYTSWFKNRGVFRGGGKGGTCPPLEFRGQMPPPYNFVGKCPPPPYFWLFL